MSKQISLSDLSSKATIGQIISADHEAANLLASIGLDVKKHEQQSLRSVCRTLKWSEGEVLKWIKNKCQTQNGKAPSGFGDDLVKWSRYLTEHYHTRNVKRLDEIARDFPRVRKIHNNQYVWLKDMQWQFSQFQDALKMYYEFEEKKFFPLFKKMNQTANNLLYGTLRKVERSVQIVKEDQSKIGGYMRKIKEDSNGFKNPANACSTLRILNHNFEALFTAVDEQFKVEKKNILPALQDKIEAVH